MIVRATVAQWQCSTQSASRALVGGGVAVAVLLYCSFCTATVCCPVAVLLQLVAIHITHCYAVCNTVVQTKHICAALHPCTATNKTLHCNQVNCMLVIVNLLLCFAAVWCYVG